MGKFNVSKLKELFEKSQENDVISLKEYNDGFRELLNFFAMMGTMFSFVAKDISDKVNILDRFMSGSRSDEYVHIEAILELEKREGIANRNDKGFVSASRTILRLHRALLFIADLFEAMLKSEENHIGHLTKDVYKRTLAPFHTLLVRKGAELAMVHGTPYRDKLLELISQVDGQPKLAEPEVRKVVSLAASSMHSTYHKVQEMYTAQQMHDLI